ncbi:bifunctional diaminohydroxyphosphoribosylaminopyrimidine deaminase/5-amino-6-(5-phosphoribosylamino)uracil reductase RibD [Candidatus Synechococcus calcipolaris G9]|uniref:Riboflavin biosynthesis protein RibD n=1 Tax=Candidatus Synechococcus calcipolaris G9 TaxID=1497997 RepID=A0ABT6EYG4_9SYNE|nr:bifunctional diaminohydroxyphosphoribosylaminopyrimidine deaminase/5-amino-6-(5-phosphoribosylamino)uracil reductase RibD [Candidatus Synechococcus calcipolaris]MDG2989930.1 bifunctional diaminohydroxyphosphoribosylaminopyrimidine deaminase/5-amino-6-(5-phosphoribosylamino)uracil reductase RibD [Candidatus Synechococcus calcipolaris G9]
MQRCLALANQGRGYTAPNPLVGCVIVYQDQVIGEGFHPKAGEPHAEVFALKSIKDDHRSLLNQSTLYVNLEPCNHYGRTPPCTEAILKSGIKKVVVGMIDPDPRVSGQGIQRLETAGIQVIVGIEEVACQVLNEAFIHRVRYQRPFGIFKYAMTLDGKIASSQGHSTWISGTPARAMVHQLRAESDAVIVGGNTVRRDNPHLTSHRSQGPNPLRVVMSRSLDLPRHSHLWTSSPAPTLVVTSSSLEHPLVPFLQNQGVDVVRLAPLTPTTVMEHLYQRGMMTVLWECGGTLGAAAIAEGMVQKIWAFIAPKLIGGQEAPSPVADMGLTKMTDALALERVQWQQVGDDILMQGYLPMETILSDTPASNLRNNQPTDPLGTLHFA